jgi:hypothetical protein
MQPDWQNSPLALRQRSLMHEKVIFLDFFRMKTVTIAGRLWISLWISWGKPVNNHADIPAADFIHHLSLRHTRVIQDLYRCQRVVSIRFFGVIHRNGHTLTTTTKQIYQQQY